jgi:hypothetical protein
MRSHFFCHSEGAQGDRRISKYEMLRFSMHDKKNVEWALPTNSLEKNRLSEPY